MGVFADEAEVYEYLGGIFEVATKKDGLADRLAASGVVLRVYYTDPEAVVTVDMGARSVKTGSWLARSEQGRGYGTRMRRALVTAFADHLGARTFHTGYVEGNDASRRVSEKLGYSPNGDFTIVVQGGVACTEHQMVLRADDIVRDDAVEVAGAEAVRRFLGLDAHP